MVHISNRELLGLDVTILIPAALENQINKDNADEVKARIVLEAANGPRPMRPIRYYLRKISW